MKKLTFTFGIIILTSLTISAQRANNPDRPDKNDQNNKRYVHPNIYHGYYNNHKWHQYNQQSHPYAYHGYCNNYYGNTNNHCGYFNNHPGHNNSIGFGHYQPNNFGWTPMSPSDFNLGCNSIRKNPFDRDRLNAAIRFLRNNYISVKQVRTIMQMFTFESTKLKFAKYAFRRTYDIRNYYLVFDCLTFNSSKKELDNYINSQNL